MLTSLKGLLNVKTTSNEALEPNHFNINSGAEILNHYQESWSELHNINESNAAKACGIAQEINELHSKITNDHNNITKILQLLTNSQTLKNGIDNCVMKINNLYDSFEKIETELFTLEDLIDKVELEQKKINHRYQLGLYKEKKLASLESARTILAGRHAQNIIDHELKQKEILTERQQVFAHAFHQDLETFKTVGEIPKIQIKNKEPSALLEEIQLDYDKKELDQFLEET